MGFLKRGEVELGHAHRFVTLFPLPPTDKPDGIPNPRVMRTRPSHEPAGTPLRAAQRPTALAPIISKRRSARSPILEVLPSRSLPPLERWTGVSPSQAAKSRPRRNVWAGGASAMRAAAVTA